MIEQYRNYFKHLAENHPALLHQDAKGKRTFFNINIEETQQQFRSGIKEKGTAMYLIDYTSNVFENRRIAMGGFVIMTYCNPKGSQGEKYIAKALTETTVYNILGRMSYDSRNGEPLFNYSLDELNDISVVSFYYKADANYVGHLCTFKFADNWKECIDEVEWADL